MRDEFKIGDTVLISSRAGYYKGSVIGETKAYWKVRRENHKYKVESLYNKKTGKVRGAGEYYYSSIFEFDEEIYNRAVKERTHKYLANIVSNINYHEFPTEALEKIVEVIESVKGKQWEKTP